MGVSPIKPGESLSVEEAEAYLGPDFFDLFRNQLLITAINKLGGTITVPVTEIDASGEFMLTMEIDQANGLFTLKTEKKQ